MHCLVSVPLRSLIGPGLPNKLESIQLKASLALMQSVQAPPLE